MMKHKNRFIIAKRILSEAFEQSIDLRLKDIVVDYRGVANTILRGEVIAPSENVPATVIVKHSNRQKGHLYREWAALEFLNGLPDVQEMVPDLYGGDREAELLVMEDLGSREARLLGNIVEGNDAQKAGSSGICSHPKATPYLATRKKSHIAQPRTHPQPLSRGE